MALAAAFKRPLRLKDASGMVKADTDVQLQIPLCDSHENSEGDTHAQLNIPFDLCAIAIVRLMITKDRSSSAERFKAALRLSTNENKVWL
jgi:hypothetical protein